MIPVNYREIYRYLGLANHAEPEENVRVEVEKAVQEIQELSQPVYHMERFPLAWQNGFPILEHQLLESHDLARNLKDCDEVILLGCTIGLAVDRAIRRAAVSSAFHAAALQAAAASYVEQYCNTINDKITAEEKKDGRYTHARYSPGYGDLPLSFQKEFFRLTDLTKHTGITLTEGCLMVPVKSITALIGISKKPVFCQSEGCDTCRMKDTCTYRR
jgi:hypothetical protein